MNYDLLKAEYLKRDWLLSHVQRDDGWKGGTLPVPFKGQQASSVSFGALTADTDVAIEDIEDEFGETIADYTPYLKERCLSVTQENILPIYFHLSIFSDNKLNLLANSDIFVFPTYYPPEGHPWVIVEAISAVI